MRQLNRMAGHRIGSTVVSLAIIIALFTIPGFYKVILLAFILFLAFGSISFFRDHLF